MQQVLTIKLKILPDEAGKKLLEETMAAYSRACSFVAERIAEDHLPLNRCSIHKAVYRSCREQFSLPSQMSAILKEEAEQPDRPPFPGAPGQPCLEQGLFPCVGQATYTAALQREHHRGKDPCPIQGRCLRVGF